MIVNAEKCSSGLWNLKRNHRNVCFAEEVGEFGGDAFVDLKFNCQIKVLLHQDLGVTQSNLQAVLVVQLNQVHLMLIGSPAKALTHCTGKRIVPLRSVADSKPLATQYPEMGRVFVAFYSPQKALVLQRPKQPKTYGSFYPRPLHNLAESQCLSLVVEFAKHGTGARDRLSVVSALFSAGA